MTAREAPVLEARGLGHRFGSRVVLDDFTLALGEGELVALLGPNGSGKSTAFSILAGLLPRQRGELRHRGRSIAGPDRALRTELGVVFQSPSLDPKLPARRNLLLAARLRGFSGAEGRRRADELLAAAGLADRADDLVRTFSGGMKRRLDIARALLSEPSVLLMDEPTAGLDEAAFRETWERLGALRSGRRLSVLVATHRPEEAEGCDRVAILTRGRIAVADTPEALRDRVGSDVLTVEVDAAVEASALAREVASRFDVEAVAHGSRVVIDCERGHELVPRLVEAFPPGRLRSVSLRRPSLGDVFLKVTGHALGEDQDAHEPADDAAAARPA